MEIDLYINGRRCQRANSTHALSLSMHAKTLCRDCHSCEGCMCASRRVLASVWKSDGYVHRRRCWRTNSIHTLPLDTPDVLPAHTIFVTYVYEYICTCRCWRTNSIHTLSLSIYNQRVNQLRACRSCHIRMYVKRCVHTWTCMLAHELDTHTLSPLFTPDESVSQWLFLLWGGYD